jgi:hypothetical protein
MKVVNGSLVSSTFLFNARPASRRYVAATIVRPGQVHRVDVFILPSCKGNIFRQDLCSLQGPQAAFDASGAQEQHFSTA